MNDNDKPSDFAVIAFTEEDAIERVEETFLGTIDSCEVAVATEKEMDDYHFTSENGELLYILSNIVWED